MQMKSVCRVHRSSLPLDAKRGLIVTERLSIRFALASAGSFFSSFPMCQNKARSIIENLHFTRARGQQKYFEMHKLNQHVRMLSPLAYLHIATKAIAWEIDTVGFDCWLYAAKVKPSEVSREINHDFRKTLSTKSVCSFAYSMEQNNKEDLRTTSNGGISLVLFSQSNVKLSFCQAALNRKIVSNINFQ